MAFKSFRHRRRSLRKRLNSAIKAAFPEARLRRLVGSASNIFTYTSLKERLVLYEQARAAVHLGRFLEIGSYLGASTVVLAEAMRRYKQGEGKVVCVDTWMNDAMTEGRRPTRTTFDENVKPWRDFIVPVQANAQDPDLPVDGQFDLVFIDGDHTYDAVTHDLGRFAPMLRPGGRLVMHDVDRPDVARALGELMSTSQWTISAHEGILVSLTKGRTRLPSRALHNVTTMGHA